MFTWQKLGGILLLATVLAACNGGSSGGGGGSDPGGDPGSDPGDGSQGRVFVVAPTNNATFEATEAFISARPGDTIRFECGFFSIDSTLLLSHTEAVTIEGCGMDETVLSFRESNGVEGILVNSARGITVQDLTIADPAGNGLELRSVDHGTVRNVRAFWSSGGGAQSANPVSEANYQGENSPLQVACTDPATQDPRAPENELGDTTSPDYTVSQKAGRYGIYPVKSSNILIEGSESIGASDAGIYVGQTSTAIIRDSRAVYNVFGFEIENVRHGEYDNNLAECNTGGFLVYDLDNLTQYGERTIMHDNVSRMNNSYNFAAGGFVANVPPGSGMITLSYDRIDVYDNVFEDNNTGGIIHVSYELFPEGAGRPTDNKIDFYTEGMRIFRNTFRNNGNNLPAPTTNDLVAQDVARVLPALVGVKTAAGCALAPGECPVDGTTFRGAHIVWDGLLDEYDPDCPYPVDSNGDPVPEEENFEGKPRHTDEHPNPECHYNKYKFHEDGTDNPPRKKPLFFASCIDANNEFSDDSVTYSNFHGTRGLEAALLLLSEDPLSSLLNPTNLQSIVAGVPEFPADLDKTPHDCEAQYGSNLERIEPVVIPPFEPSGDYDAEPTPEEIAQLCEAEVDPGEVNFAAASVNCPRLDQYHLFSDPEDPTSDPNGRSFPFVLNTKLFSDYAVKYRVAFLPPGTQITYAAPGADKPTGTLVFPTGTIIAKTFSFLAGGEEEHIETRLLIKRETSRGTVRWDGVPYVWETDGDGSRVARRRMSGRDGIAAEWDYENVESGVRHTGSTDNYAVPNANQCLSCHANNDLEPGSAPIGPKVRNLNRAYRSESMVVTDQGRHPIAGNNQIAWLCDNGLMAGCPADLGVDSNTGVATNLERVPRFNVPGDAGHPAGSDADVEARTRAWLESNCQHCHNPRGFAANTGYYLDVFRQVDTSYGICKGPTATGAEGSGGREVDVKPMDAAGSILAYRIGPEADTPAAQMPPISRSVVHTEAHALVRDWINNVVVADDDRYPGSESCAGG